MSRPLERTRSEFRLIWASGLSAVTISDFLLVTRILERLEKVVEFAQMLGHMRRYSNGLMESENISSSKNDGEEKWKFTEASQVAVAVARIETRARGRSREQRRSRQNGGVSAAGAAYMTRQYCQSLIDSPTRKGVQRGRRSPGLRGVNKSLCRVLHRHLRRSRKEMEVQTDGPWDDASVARISELEKLLRESRRGTKEDEKRISRLMGAGHPV